MRQRTTARLGGGLIAAAIVLGASACASPSTTPGSDDAFGTPEKPVKLSIIPVQTFAQAWVADDKGNSRAGRS